MLSARVSSWPVPQDSAYPVESAARLFLKKDAFLMYGPTNEQVFIAGVWFFSSIVLVPLGVWKLVEIVIWFFSNIHWGSQ
jgi:hypothetical protein